MLKRQKQWLNDVPWETAPPPGWRRRAIRTWWLRYINSIWLPITHMVLVTMYGMLMLPPKPEHWWIWVYVPIYFLWGCSWLVYMLWRKRKSSR